MNITHLHHTRLERHPRDTRYSLLQTLAKYGRKKFCNIVPRTGDGLFKYKNGEYFSGNFENGSPNGEGVHRYRPASELWEYEGTFRDGKFDGKGKQTFKNGDIYEGEWMDGKRNGFGIMTKANGESYERFFKDDVLQEN